uniref:Uncharacterized protein n=1 Tax=Lygus hesperus TaxID=30085 RepID=A0A146L7M5_LYGHE
MTHKNFQYISERNSIELLQDELRENPLRIPYHLTFSPNLPGCLQFRYIVPSPYAGEPTTHVIRTNLSPQGFVFYDIYEKNTVIFPNVDQLVSGIKRFIQKMKEVLGQQQQQSQQQQPQQQYTQSHHGQYYQPNYSQYPHQQSHTSRQYFSQPSYQYVPKQRMQQDHPYNYDAPSFQPHSSYSRRTSYY